MNAGALARQIVQLRQRLIAVLAELEGAIDFPEDAGDAGPRRRARAALARFHVRCARWRGAIEYMLNEVVCTQQ